MRCSAAVLLIVMLVGVTGCGEQKPFDGPTVDAFTGRLVHEGNPVSFPPSETVQLKLILHEKPESFGIPIKSDGTFQIGWMPIGKYSATLIRERNEGGKKAAPIMYNVPGGLEIKNGQTEYLVELGKGWKL
ncbi:MAG: hypothetical protein RMJ56_01440 [Gemmataceae bacterium]|nr:DUF3823 domain-containing protein [Gemmata sp.]MDW8196245.1 hypothetical protein [Gemmataceae bacterium]